MGIGSGGKGMRRAGIRSTVTQRNGGSMGNSGAIR